MCEPMYPAQPVTQTFMRSRSLAQIRALPQRGRALLELAVRCAARHGSHMKNIPIPTAALAAAISVLAACSHDTPPPQAPAPQATTTPTLTSTPQRRSDQDISLSKSIRDLCKIDDSDRAPKFDFDSSQLSSADRDILQQVAKCMTDGALKGRNVELIGRADPRGEQEYNMGLGSSRATAARSFLKNLGIADSRMSETSRGALDATGHDEESWAKDRRVDLRALP
jgi:peptidoglycan-associated lipoprotein